MEHASRFENEIEGIHICMDQPVDFDTERGRVTMKSSRCLSRRWRDSDTGWDGWLSGRDLTAAQEQR
jgi:hypothetical protein